MKKQYSILIGIAVPCVFILVASIGLLLLRGQNEIRFVPPSINPEYSGNEFSDYPEETIETTVPSEEVPTYTKPIVRYDTIEHQNCVETNYFECDYSLIGQDSEGKTIVVESNMTALYDQQFPGPENFARGVRLHPFYLPQNSEKLIFISSFGSSACCNLYSYNTKTRTLVALKNGKISSLTNDLPSPDKSKILNMSSDGKSLMVVDVLEDAVIATVTAKPGETFTKMYGGYGGDALGEYEWMGNTTFVYSVFNENQKVDMNKEEYRNQVAQRSYTIQ